MLMFTSWFATNDKIQGKFSQFEFTHNWLGKPM